MGRKIAGGSNIGGLKETREMLDFATEHGITADVEMILTDYVNTAMERILKSDVRYQFVINVENSLWPSALHLSSTPALKTFKRMYLGR